VSPFLRGEAFDFSGESRSLVARIAVCGFKLKSEAGRAHPGKTKNPLSREKRKD
jgi:hypothetical protein